LDRSVNLATWWFKYGWRELLLKDYAVSLAVAGAWLVVGLLLRRRRRDASMGAISAWWLLPVAAWALQALSAALTTTQLDLVTGASRVPFMVMYAITSVLAGLCVFSASYSAAKLARSGSFTGWRSRPFVLVSAAWIGATVAWCGVIMREILVVEAS
jgi:hypothetical protein